MKKLLLFTFLTMSFAAFIFAQHPTCDGIRYKNQTFTEVSTTFNVQFGSNTTAGGETQDLMMDIYEPVGDNAQLRPVVILAFGGAFITGTREDIAFLCEEYAKRGFVAATIDYRIIDVTISDSSVIYDAVVKAVSDMKAAIRFFRQDADNFNTYKVDTSLLFVGGVSAGAIAACHTAYLDDNDPVPSYLMDLINANGGLDGNSSTNTQYSTKVHGVLNFSGALQSASWINAGQSPLFSVHDENDFVVPYLEGVTTILPAPVYLEGSGSLDLEAEDQGIDHFLITIPNSFLHVSYFSATAGLFLDSIYNTSGAFLENLICNGFVPVREIANPLNLEVFPQPAPQWINVTGDFGKGPYTWQIITSHGQVVSSGKDSGVSSLRIPVGEIPDGYYWLQMVDSDTQQGATKGIVIVR